MQENTKTVVNSKSISKDGGICTFRSNVWVQKNATNSKLSLSCESLMLDSISRSDTIPVDTIENDEVTFAHEAKIGKISDEAIFYLMTRGISEEEAKALIVRGFAEPIAKAFPVEYAVEMNRLINLELEGTIGQEVIMKYIINETPLKTTNNFKINNLKIDLDIEEETINDLIINTKKNK